jgi:hypothetical protein
MIVVPPLVSRGPQAPSSLTGWIGSPDLLFAAVQCEPLRRCPSRRPVGMSLTPPAVPMAGPLRHAVGPQATTGAQGVGGQHGPNNRRLARGGIQPPRTLLPLRRSLVPILLRRSAAEDASLRASRRRFTPIGPRL